MAEMLDKRVLAVSQKVAERLPTPSMSRLPSLLAILAVGLLIYAALSFRKTYEQVPALLIGALGLFLLLCACYLVVAWWRHSRSILQLDEERKAEQIIEQAIESGKVDASHVWCFARKQIDGYHAGTKVRAAQSFLYAQVAAFVGLAVLVGGAVAGIMIFLSKPDSASVIPWVTTGLGGVGAGLSTYIAKQHLATHRMSLNQLNYYFHQPVVTHQVLQAERLANALGDADKRKEVLASVVIALTEMARDVNTASLLLSQTDEEKRTRVMGFLRALRREKPDAEGAEQEGKPEADQDTQKAGKPANGKAKPKVPKGGKDAGSAPDQPKKGPPAPPEGGPQIPTPPTD